MTSDEAQQAQDVVLGMFLTSSHPTTVLFDSEASHSFITSSFVANHNLSIANKKHTMLVSSPEGEMRTKHICPTISISIRGGRLSVEPRPFRLQEHRHHTWHRLVKQVCQSHPVCQKGSKVDHERWNYSRVCSHSAGRLGQYAESDKCDRFRRNLSGSRIPRCISRRIIRYATGSRHRIPY
jgi:hypothetical protein